MSTREFVVHQVRKQPYHSTTAIIDEPQQNYPPSYSIQSRNGSFSKGKRLGQKDFTYWFGLVTQVVLTSISGLFLALAVATILLDGRAILLTETATGLERTVESAIKLSPTVFPIVFAAITGRFLRSLGLFLLHRRIRLGTLERLLGSQSFFASIERQIAMQGSYLLGTGITVLWMLSPVGGQSALRLLSSAPHLTSTNTTVRYQPIEASVATTMVGSDTAESFWPVWASTYMTSLRTSQFLENKTQDLFGNVRIPNLNNLAPYAETQEGFITIDHSQTVPYVSLLGIPMADVPPVGNSSFQISSQYFDVACTDLHSLDNSSAFALFPTTASRLRSDAQYFALTTDLKFVNNVTVGQVVSFNFTSVNNDVWSLATCTLQSRDVDSLITCIDGACRADAIRNSRTASSQSYSIDPTSIFNLLYYLPVATIEHYNKTSPALEGASMTEWWIKDPSINIASISADGSFDVFDIPLDTFTTNLGIVLNTLWQSTICNQFLAGTTYFPTGTLYNDTASSESFNLSTATASVTRIDGTQFVCNKAFASILIMISIILLVEGLVSLVLMSINIVPDTLGYVSSYTRDNIYFPSNEASHLDGLERSSAMKDVYAILGDVKAGDEVGHIAFTSDADAQPLRKGRLYD